MNARESKCLIKAILLVTRTRAFVDRRPFGPITLSAIQVHQFCVIRREHRHTKYMFGNMAINGRKAIVEKNTGLLSA